jgi:beta-galactosidase
MLELILAEQEITSPVSVPEGVEVTQRGRGEQKFIFVLNHHLEAQEIVLPEPMRDLLTGQVYEDRMSLAGRDVAILVAQ